MVFTVQPDYTKVTESKRRWARHVAQMGHDKCIWDFHQQTWKEETTWKT